MTKPLKYRIREDEKMDGSKTYTVEANKKYWCDYDSYWVWKSTHATLEEAKNQIKVSLNQAIIHSSIVAEYPA